MFRFIFFLFCSLPAAYGGARRTNWTKVAGKCRAAPHRWLFHISIDYVAASSISPVLRFNVIRSTRISTHTGVTLLRLDRLALASHLLRAHTHARASTIISSSWSRRPSSSHGKILVASFSPATFCKKKKEFCNMKYSSHWNCANCLSLCFKKKKEKRKKVEQAASRYYRYSRRRRKRETFCLFFQVFQRVR